MRIAPVRGRSRRGDLEHPSFTRAGDLEHPSFTRAGDTEHPRRTACKNKVDRPLLTRCFICLGFAHRHRGETTCWSRSLRNEMVHVPEPTGTAVGVASVDPADPGDPTRLAGGPDLAVLATYVNMHSCSLSYNLRDHNIHECFGRPGMRGHAGSCAVVSIKICWGHRRDPSLNIISKIVSEFD